MNEMSNPAADRLRKLVDSAPKVPAPEPGADHAGEALPPLPLTETEAQIAKKPIAPARFVVDGLLPVGLALCSAPPKIGKTWLNCGLARAVATGDLFAGARKVRKGPVLFLDLEGNDRRSQQRYAAIRTGEASSDLHIAYSWPPMPEGLELLELKIMSLKAALVIVDVWALFRSPRPRNADPYQHDLTSARAVKEVADRTGCAIVLTHHNRKQEAADWASEASGSAGLTGGCDTLLSLSRKRGSADAVMKITGRDVEDQELALAFKDGRWTILGGAVEVLMSQTRQTLHSALAFHGRPMKPAQLAEETGLSRDLVKKTLQRMLRDGTVKADTSGAYTAS